MRPLLSSAHPRSRGEHFGGDWNALKYGGSSPLARGTPLAPTSASCAGRLIPARAGNTSRSSRPTRRPTAHPRSRGEHEMGRRRANSTSGSSPLARGTPCHIKRISEYHRLIPARAGNTAGKRCRDYGAAAHPRSRGEHTVDLAGAVISDGSSPLARGTQAVVSVESLG